ncbi:MAG: Ribosomal protein L31 (Modular protein) [Candidatus Daviesbacteria bacterium GW2011_GWA1_41_61]|uniref:Large ribosomal subunit protein bL31 n=1 Tax=Candidatus Daviesbacteria bacterium GW2011_GWA2_40_9 TaxID=1618424 RepID=A0A0G0U285_9BACT|nr:MAG: ribosomal protein L31 [Candidatus Daviesbacteria bacterium GW2011_GWC1_40_9]KKR83198.1 MAG: Ribosomal protein L31 (Modular protein) [Candidatus Daviesbacteria bacterium GW2011_GWA2_40_9]KKR93545.1 MAG: Ribosomal protein L31 (Modular protein) [Candidatus Daviesbacteria bacterium GW2011_GWB1_41_15]KKS14905.1 MAG: Ribosomal protein L31 (Modular protein) [Candidatus Daviesbacteria bacterium GW2011_GWA1_41_61]
MKASIHPTYYNDAKVTCVCGNTFVTGSTLQAIKVEICAKCHPFFTGQQKYIDTQGQVEKFGKRGALAEVKKAERAKITAVRASKVQKQTTEKKSLKDLLLQARKNVAS